MCYDFFKKVRINLTVALILFSSIVKAQDFSETLYKLKYDLEIDSSFLTNSKLNNKEKLYLRNQLDLLLEGKTNITVNSINELKKKKSTTNLLLLGDYYLFNENPKDSLSLDNYTKALNIAIQNKDTLLVNESLKKILFQLFKSRKALEIYPYYLDLYKNYIDNDVEKATFYYHRFNYLGSKFRKENIDSLKWTLNIANETNDIFIKAKLNQAIGLHYDFFKKEKDSSLKYYNKAKNLLESKPYQKYRNELFGIYGNIGLLNQENKDYKKAKFFFTKADSIKIPKYRYVEKVKINNVLSDNAKLEGKLNEALHYLSLSKKYSDTLNEYNKAKQLNEINIKYQTAEKEKQIIVEQQKRKQNQNIAIGLGGSLALGSIIAFLIFKNTKRKQKLAEQQKELETQKLNTVLKDQELNAIDAMIEGQEKERQRIANDLHDDLGGLMATVKLHFNALKDKKSPELFEKTNSLIDEAYNKVRSVAHAKNSGVIAKHGLLKSIKEMADKISISNKLNIEVVDYGLDARLENSLELTIFRITQELVSNAIKHAEASEITINLTNHDDSINLMVEDNGKGFDTSQITKTSKGMGIGSIDKRIEHLDGKMTIESEKNKGTTVIIDIPL